MVSSTFGNRLPGRSRRDQEGDCVHAFDVPGPPKPPVPPVLSSLPLLTGCIRFAKTEMHLSAKRGIFLTQVLRPEAEKIFGNFIKFSGAAAVSVIRFIFGRLFAIWRESHKLLLARRRVSRRAIWPARESCRPGPMSVTLPPARSGPPDRIGVRRKHDRRGSRSGPAAAWGDPRRTANRRSGRSPRSASHDAAPVGDELGASAICVHLRHLRTIPVSAASHGGIRWGTRGQWDREDCPQMTQLDADPDGTRSGADAFRTRPGSDGEKPLDLRDETLQFVPLLSGRWYGRASQR